MSGNNSTDGDSLFNDEEVPIPRIVRFWLLLILDIPAVCCTAFLLYHLLLKRQLRQALHNHIVIVILINIFLTQLFDVPSYIAFVHLGYVWWQTPGFCFFWLFVDTGLYSMLTILLTYGSLERHILVFHSNLVSSRRKRLLFHYISLSFVVMFCIVFYFYIIVLIPCEHEFDYNQAWCSYPCYYDVPTLGVYDTIVNGIVLTLFIILFDIGLVIRHMSHRHRMQQGVQWRKYRKMLIQLLSISALGLFFNVPQLIIIGAEQCGASVELLAVPALYTTFFTFFINLLLPYVCLILFPELRRLLYKHIQKLPRFNKTNTVIPLNISNK